MMSFVSTQMKDGSYMDIPSEVSIHKAEIERAFKPSNEFIEMDMTASPQTLLSDSSKKEQAKTSNKQLFKIMGQYFFMSRVRDE